MSAKETRKAMEKLVCDCDQFLYAYTPEKTTRYVFKEVTISGLTAAYDYARSFLQLRKLGE